MIRIGSLNFVFAFNVFVYRVLASIYCFTHADDPSLVIANKMASVRTGARPSSQVATPKTEDKVSVAEGAEGDKGHQEKPPQRQRKPSFKNFRRNLMKMNILKRRDRSSESHDVTVTKSSENDDAIASIEYEGKEMGVDVNKEHVDSP